MQRRRRRFKKNESAGCSTQSEETAARKAAIVKAAAAAAAVDSGEPSSTQVKGAVDASSSADATEVDKNDTTLAAPDGDA